jgi:hypothetical protein
MKMKNFDRLCTLVVLIIVFVLIFYQPKSRACVTDTECGCTDDCLDPAPKE